VYSLSFSENGRIFPSLFMRSHLEQEEEGEILDRQPPEIRGWPDKIIKYEAFCRIKGGLCSGGASVEESSRIRDNLIGNLRV